jgi:ornithine cyclodeaminase/alanine dehydrogenase-like protein (mu-crystallin family)
MTLFLDEHHMRQLHEGGHVTMLHYVEAIERVYREQGEGRVALLPRQNFWIGDADAANRGPSLKLACAVVAGLGVMGIPMYSAGFRPGAIDLWIALMSTTTGEMLAHLHGQMMSHWKTGATAALATRRLARPDASVAGFVGTGYYAQTQALGLAAVRPIRAIRCYSRGAEGRERFAAWARRALPGVEVTPVASAREAVADVDILVAVTTSRTPVVEGAWIAPGTHCNFVGMHYPEAREVDSAAIRRARVIVDDLAQAWGEKGEILIPLAKGEITREHVAGDIGSVLAGKIAGRTSDREITVFCSGGTALEYVGACAMLDERARAAGIGQALDAAQPRPKSWD